MKGHLYFVGIVGHAMRGLALACRGLGYDVTGFDPGAEVGEATRWLANHDLKWTKTFEPQSLDSVTAVIITGAHVSEDAPVIKEARSRRIAIKSSAELFGELTQNKHVIDVAGTHGKTTTTALIAWIFESAGLKPDFLIGIKPFNFDTSVRLTGSNLVVGEGDEYRASPLDGKSKLQYYHPDVLVLTAIEHDHPDLFPNLASVVKRFRQIVQALPKDGRLIACTDSNTVIEVAGAASCAITTYGLDNADYSPRNATYLATGIEFDIENGGGLLGHVSVGLYGKHNVVNTLAAVAVALQEGLTFDEVVKSLQGFAGTYRRFNVLTASDSAITVVDDYGHHPTEVATNIEAARLHFPGRRVVAILRPHTYSRTAALLAEFRSALNKADLVYVTDIEGAREIGEAHKVSGRDITRGLRTPALFVSDRSELVKRVTADAKSGDVILCFTVSGYEKLANELADALTKKAG